MSKASINAEVEQIRLTATSPHNLIVLLTAFWLRHGIKVTFKDYPANFSLSVSNSHNSPKGYQQNWCGHSDHQGVPNGYPGWSGTWEGSIEILDTCTIAKKGMSFSRLTGAWSDSVMDVWYIQTGTGGGGNSFRYNGMLWLYDFPLMHIEFEKNGGRLDVYKKEYGEHIHNYQQRYNQELTKKINNNQDLRRCLQLKTDLAALGESLDIGVKQTKTSITHEFNSTHLIKFPEISSAFEVNQDAVKNIYLQTTTGKKVLLPELQELFQQIEDLTKEANIYIEEHPEFLF